MPPAQKRRRQPERDDLIGELQGHDAAAERQDVRVVVLARQARRVQIVAESRADAGDLVRGYLFALSAAAHHDAPLGAPFGDLTRHREADRRIVDGLLAIGAAIVDAVPQNPQPAFEMLFEKKSGMIRADRNPHDPGIVLCSSGARGVAIDIPVRAVVLKTHNFIDPQT